MNNSNFSIKYWAEEDRPREKLLLKGRQILSSAELLAIIIGSGTRELSAVELSKNILLHFDNDLNALARLQVADLKKFKGIGEAKAVSIISALELGRRRQISTTSVKSRVTSSKDAYHLLSGELRDLNHEVFKILVLNRNNRVLRTETISIGGIAGTVVDPKVIFKRALDHHASSIILCHNHPSGNLNPSKQDIDITKKIIEAGKIIEIQVLDHLIISYEGYFSFADEGLM